MAGKWLTIRIHASHFWSQFLTPQKNDHVLFCSLGACDLTMFPERSVWWCFLQATSKSTSQVVCHSKLPSPGVVNSIHCHLCATSGSPTWMPSFLPSLTGLCSWGSTQYSYWAGACAAVHTPRSLEVAHGLFQPAIEVNEMPAPLTVAVLLLIRSGVSLTLCSLSSLI